MTKVNPEKQKTIDEINRLIAAWQPMYCQLLLREAERMHKAATAPPPTPYIKTHVLDETGQKALCGQTGAERFVSREEFEQLSISRCMSCIKMLKKLKGEDYDKFSKFWLQDHQKNLILAIFHLGGQKTGVWLPIGKLLPESPYGSRNSLLHGIKRLERRGFVETKLVNHRNHVRLIMDCVKERTEGHFQVSVIDIIEASLSTEQTAKDSV